MLFGTFNESHLKSEHSFFFNLDQKIKEDETLHYMKLSYLLSVKY